MLKSKPDLSVVILCFKSGEFAKVFVKTVQKILNKNKINYEIILVGNYWPKSNDSTPAIIKKLSQKYSRVNYVAKPKKFAYHKMGWDMRMGLKLATGRAIAVIDGDGQMDATDIPKLFKKLKKGKYDLCKTKRTSRKDGAYRYIISLFYNLLMKLLFPGIVADINSKPKLFTQDVYRDLKLISNDWFIDAEIMIKARKKNLKIGEIKTGFAKNTSRKSFITFKENFEFIRNIIKWRILEFNSKT